MEEVISLINHISSSNENEKKNVYLGERVNVEKATCTPAVFLTSEGLGITSERLS